MSNDAAAAKTQDAAPPPPPSDEMTTEEKSFLMKALWASLIEPKWTKDDLIDFGKAIFAKKGFKEMSDAEFAKVFPFLTQITANLGKRLMEKKTELSAASPAETEDAPAEAAETEK